MTCRLASNVSDAKLTIDAAAVTELCLGTSAYVKLFGQGD